MKNKIIYISLFSVILVANLFGYYFGIYLPKKEKLAEPQKQEQVVEQKENIIEEISELNSEKSDKISGSGDLLENNKKKIITTQKIDIKNLTYNQVINSKKELADSTDKSIYDGKIIKWKAKISNYYSQIDGIKFCVVDKDHPNVEIDEACDWFWAFSDSLMDGDNLEKNPSWDGRWVPYTLNYYNVPFNKNSRYYNDIYTVTGKINGVRCGDENSDLEGCILDIDILSITK